MGANQRMLRKERTSVPVHVFFILFGLCCVVPLVTVISASLTRETELVTRGFALIPRDFDLSAYRYLLRNPAQILNAYEVTIYITAIGTLFGTLFMAMAGFVLARDKTRVKKALTWYLFFPTLFSGGLVSTYIIMTQYYHLRNNLMAIILPGLINVFHVFILRTFFQQLPAPLYDAAKIDGASEFAIFFRIALPLSTPSLATIAFLNALSKWNDWYSCMLYIDDEKLYTLQYLLQRMIKSLETLIYQVRHNPQLINLNLNDLPGENLRMAMLIVAIGPIMLFFPFFQKYFTRGLTVGSVKG